MTESSVPENTRSYGCSMGCGNPYDYVLVDVRSGESIFPCVPCYVRLAIDMVNALVEPDSPEAQEAVEAMRAANLAQVPGPRGRRDKHNAPVEVENPEAFEAFDTSVPVNDEFPAGN